MGSRVTEHSIDCDWQLDQYDFECSCGGTLTNRNSQMTINVTVVIGHWVGEKRVEVLHRKADGSETRLGVLNANHAHQTFVCDGQDIVVREIIPTPAEPEG